MKPNIRTIWIAPVAVLTVAATACSTTDADTTDAGATDAGATAADATEIAIEAGAASRTITPQGWEPWSDTNGNHVFDGDLDDPDGVEPFTDVNGNGRFDTYLLAGTDDGRAISAVHDDLEVTVTVFSDGEDTVALAGVDALVSRSDLTERARNELAARGVEIDSFNWMSSHSHESLAPFALEIAGELLLSHDYWDFVVDQVVDATEEAYRSMEPATLTLADSSTPLAPGNSWQADVRAPYVIDNTLTVMRFDRAHGDEVAGSGDTIATVVHWANHPEMTSWDTQVSADFPGVMRRRLQAHYPGSVAVFAQGPLGSQITGEDATFTHEGVDYTDEPGPWSPGSFDKADALGNALADGVIDAIEGSGELQDDCGITSAEHRTIYAAIDNPTMIAGAESLGATFVDGDGSPHSSGPVYIADDVAHLAVCDLEILTNPGEVAPELVVDFADGPGWKNYMTGRYRMLTSLTNGLIGYLVHPSNFELDPANPWGFWDVDHYDETGSFSVKNTAIIDAAYRQLLGLEPVAQPDPVTVAETELDRYVGNYGDTVEVVRHGDRLAAFVPRFGTAFELFAASPTDFFARDIDLHMTFVDDGDTVTGADVTLPGARLVSLPATGLGPLISKDTDSVDVTIDEIGVSTVLPGGWTVSPGGGFSDGTSQLGVFALETARATDPTLDGFEVVGDLTTGGHHWVLFAQHDGDAFVGLALTEIGPLTYGFVLQATAELAEAHIDTVVIPALEAFVATPLPAGSGPVDDDDVDVIDLAGRSVAYVAEGVGTPTVVFEAGLGNGMASWAAVFPEVVEHTRAFAYDRPGYGGSELTDHPRDGATMVAELHQLLSATGHEPPFILVGHSLGGTLVDLFARTYPDDVAGVVLVDSRHHEFSARCLVRLGESECDLPSDADLDAVPEPVRSEWLDADATVRQIDDAPDFPDIPLTVIVAGITDATPTYASLWLEAQQNYADMVPGSRLLVAERSDHGIPVQQPEIVIDAIVEILQGAT